MHEKDPYVIYEQCMKRTFVSYTNSLWKGPLCQIQTSDRNNTWKGLCHTWTVHKKDPYVIYKLHERHPYVIYKLHERHPYVIYKLHERNPYVMHEQYMRWTLMSYRAVHKKGLLCLTWTVHEKDPNVIHEQCLDKTHILYMITAWKGPLCQIWTMHEIWCTRHTWTVHEKTLIYISSKWVNPYVIHKQCMKRTLMSYIYAMHEKDPYVMYHQCMKMAFMSFMNSACLGGSVGCTSNWWSGDCMLDHGLVGNILLWS